ncbi:MAG: ferredoxin--NADP(+) reductase [Betaproteobacteria bacterium RIFCSPLOWO2_12_FULL_65_14]|nr:MAG: ferredoxin--NADP(+) reductase [Betaproteobacteria bacterium RIFCSPLOWO2_12_FULL_65_14]
MSDKWLEGRVIENRHWTEALFSLRVAGAAIAFEAGQFVRIALDIGGERIARPFSLVNAPGDPVLEFYGIVVPEGPLSPRLARLAPGDALFVARNPAGFLVLSEVLDAETLWLVSTGTGIAPFLSILRTDAPWRRFHNVVLVHAVRFSQELTYRETIDELRQTRGLKYVSFVSREAASGSLAGRIPAAIRDGRLASAAGLKLAADSSQVMLCGNPDMLKDATAALAERGMRKHRRRAPGHITVESFW